MLCLLQKNDREFDVKCNVSGRVYHLTDIEADAKTWIDYINSMLEMQLARTRRSMSPVNV